MARGGKRPGAGRPKQKLDSVASVADIVAAIPADALDEMLRALPPDITPQGLLRAVVQSPVVPGPIRMHAAAKLLPYEVARPTATKEAGTGGLMIKLGRHGAASD